MSFGGFSEDDIKKLKVNTHPVKANTEKVHEKLNANKKVSFARNSPKPTKEIIQQKVLNDKIINNNSSEIALPQEAKLSSSASENKGIFKEQHVQENDAPEPAKQVSFTNNDTSETPTRPEKKVLDLDEFQARQKLIEEQNRKRKELLVKALADRTRQTQEEAQRLNEIQAEFKKLDAVLSSDVKILRKQIEVASVDYMEAQKRYHKIEKEFLQAKMILHQKQEKKEMLTEHLCAIIEKNEERKAEKLTSLLEKLKIDPVLNENAEDMSREACGSESSQINKISNSSITNNNLPK